MPSSTMPANYDENVNYGAVEFTFTGTASKVVASGT